MPVGRIEYLLARLPVASRVIRRLDGAREETAYLQALIKSRAASLATRGSLHLLPFESEAPPEADDLALTRRIAAAYRAASAVPARFSGSKTRHAAATARIFFLAPLDFLLSPLGTSSSLWLRSFADRKRDIDEALLRGDEAAVQAMLRDPGQTDLFFGFENLSRSLMGGPASTDIGEICDLLLRLFEAWCGGREAPPDVEELLAALDSALGIRIDFPNPFPGEVGLPTSRGIAGYRAVQALYQAARAAELVARQPAARVLEIGAGLGRTAYYAWQLGLRDYTIIDLPMTGVAQADFLGRTLGEQNIRLYGEGGKAAIRILPPSAFLDAADRYDLVLNVDSLTEMAAITAWQYVKEIEARAAVFWSVNHEQNMFRVADLFSPERAQRVIRTPYRLRAGYVEELLDQRRRDQTEPADIAAN